MKHRPYTRAVSLFLIFGLLLTGLTLPVFAVLASDANNSSNTPIPNDEWLVSDETVAQVGGLVPIEESEGLQEAVVDIFMPFSYLLVGQTKQISYTINSPGISIAWNSENTSIGSFMAVDKNDADMFSFSFWETDVCKQLYENVMNSLGYDAEATNLVDKTASDARSYMLSSEDVFVFDGHGSEGMVAFTDSNGVFTGALAVNSSVFSANSSIGADRVYIEDFAHNQLASLRVVLYLGCLTGVDKVVNGEEYNLVDATFAKGAHFVLGTTKKVPPGPTVQFFSNFLDVAQTGENNVDECIDSAIAEVGNIYVEDANGNMVTCRFPLYYVGDKLQYLS